MLTERSAPPAGAGDCVPAPWRIGAPRGKLFTVEGVWGAGKTTAARLAAARLAQAGFTVTVLHYGPEPGSAGHLSQFLETAPLRSRTGLGGYAAPHHAPVDVLLRLCREAHHQLTFFQPALAAHDAVIIDRGVYSKLAWALAVLAETSPGTDPAALLGQLHAAAGRGSATPIRRSSSTPRGPWPASARSPAATAAATPPRSNGWSSCPATSTPTGRSWTPIPAASPRYEPACATPPTSPTRLPDCSPASLDTSPPAPAAEGS